MPTPFLMLAPMRGVTTMHYRRAFVRHFQGLDAEMAPFIATVDADRINPRLLKDVLPENNSGLPLVPQLIGNKADDFVQMAIALHDLGYGEVNWNLGCPHKPIRKKRRGSGLLPHPDLVDALLDRICERSPCKVSVKVRLGVADKSELMALVPILNRHPLAEVVVHPRTAEQMYTGSVDLDAFEEAFQALEHPVRYNGDIDSPAFFQSLEKRFPTLGRFMLGRGLLANPFLCEEIKINSPHLRRCGEERTINTGIGGEMGSAHLRRCGEKGRIGRIADFHAELLESYESSLRSDHAVLGKMKEFWSYQSLHLSNGRKMFKKIKRSERLGTYKTIVREFLSEAEWMPR